MPAAGDVVREHTRNDAFAFDLNIARFLRKRTPEFILGALRFRSLD